MRSLFLLFAIASLSSACGTSHDSTDAGDAGDAGADDAPADDAAAEHPLTPRWRVLTAGFNRIGCECAVAAGEFPSVEACLEEAEDFTSSIICLNDEFNRATDAEISAYECLTAGLEMSSECSLEMGCDASASEVCRAIERRELDRCDESAAEGDPFRACGI